VERTPFSKANNHSATGEVLHFMEHKKFIIMFITVRHWSLSLATWIQSTPAPYSFKIHF